MVEFSFVRLPSLFYFRNFKYESICRSKSVSFVILVCTLTSCTIPDSCLKSSYPDVPSSASVARQRERYIELSFINSIQFSQKFYWLYEQEAEGLILAWGLQQGEIMIMTVLVLLTIKYFNYS